MFASPIPSIGLRKLAAGLVAAGLSLPASDAFALWGDKLELFAAERLTYDSNVFRLSSGVDPQTAIGSSSRADFYSTTSVGFNLDIPWSRQRFQGGWAGNLTRFDDFTQLNFSGHEGRALWLWQLGNDLSGQLGYTETKNLASFSSFSTTSALAADPVTTRLGYFNAVYNLTPSWRLRGGVSELQQTHQNDQRKINDVIVDSGNAGVAYVTAAGNQMGLQVRRDDGYYPNRFFVQGSIVDISYEQTGVGPFLNWNLTATSHVDAEVMRIRREFPQLQQRDFDDTTYRVAYIWTHSPKFMLTAIAQKDVSATEDAAASFVVSKTYSIAPTYNFTEKTSIVGLLSYSKRDYAGDPGFDPSTLPPGTTFQPGREDKVWIANATLTYRYSRTVTFLAAAQHEDRRSNVQFGDYVANIFSLTARIGF